MALKKIMALLVFASGSLASLSALACGGGLGWTDVPAQMPLSLRKVISNAEQEHDVKLEPFQYVSPCSTDRDWKVTVRSTGQLMGRIPIPREAMDADDGRLLQARLEQLLKTPREQLIALAQAKEFFYEDTRALQEDLGINGYVPDGLPYEQRTRNGGLENRLFITLYQVCSGGGGSSMPGQVNHDAYVNALEYIPGQVNYPMEAIYKKGDFKRVVLTNKDLMEEIKGLVKGNANHCPDSPHFGNDRWLEVYKRITSWDTSALLLSPLGQFNYYLSPPQAAYMLNAYRLAVQYPRSTRVYTGTVDEIVELQRELESKGIAIDKRSQLDYRGQMTIRWAKKDGDKLPASLAE